MWSNCNKLELPTKNRLKSHLCFCWSSIRIVHRKKSALWKTAFLIFSLIFKRTEIFSVFRGRHEISPYREPYSFRSIYHLRPQGFPFLILEVKFFPTTCWFGGGRKEISILPYKSSKYLLENSPYCRSHMSYLSVVCIVPVQCFPLLLPPVWKSCLHLPNSFTKYYYHKIMEVAHLPTVKSYRPFFFSPADNWKNFRASATACM